MQKSFKSKSFKSKKEISISIKIGLVYIGTVLGAGFASGQEIMRFFCDYGIMGAVGLNLTGLLFFIFGFMILEKGKDGQKKILSRVMGDKIASLFDFITISLLMLMLSGMIAGGGQAIKQFFGISSKSGSLIMSVLVFIVLIGEENGISKANEIICPILILITVLLMLKIALSSNSNFIKPYNIEKNKNSLFALLSAFIYVSYNIMSAMPVLCSIGVGCNKKDKFIGALIGGLCLTILGLVIYIPLSFNYNSIKSVDLPIMELSKKIGSVGYFGYVIIFLSACFTTAIGNGFAILKWVDSKFKADIHHIIIICGGALLFSEIGFSSIVGKIYPIFGIIGIIEMLCLILDFTKK